ncbi:MAG: CRISPR-associated helicase Cas3' [Proteobacteria bacterium]|nr:CRISPR-associated helicase Cas3' [Pseudomonadota bacterium]
MSATLQPSWLRSIDTAARHDAWVRDPCVVPPAQRHGSAWSIAKQLHLATLDRSDAGALARRALDEHARLDNGEHGRITLVVCNTVDRACQTFDSLRTAAPAQAIELIHSRFRGAERATWRERSLSRAACTHGSDRIIVATQVVEAGVDISAGCLITELAPWPSLVQRIGRCARYGGRGTVVVVDRGRDERAVPPYTSTELEAAWDALAGLNEAEGSAEVGIAALEHFEDRLPEPSRARLYPYQPQHLLLRRELEELFDTTPDLTGADLDVSRFIRSGTEKDVLVFWTDLPRNKRSGPAAPPPAERQPTRAELCAVPFLAARDWLCGKESGKSRKPRLRPGVRAWTWDWLDGEWVVADRTTLTPGRLVCVASEVGGYRVDRGFDPTSHEPVPTVAPPPSSLATATSAQLDADRRGDSESLSIAAWKTIASHGREVARIAESIAHAVSLPNDLERILSLAGQWHDLGKAHPAFQGAIRHEQRPARQDLAKAPKSAWPKPPKTYRTSDDRDIRPGLRHELASALALFAVLRRHAPLHAALLGPWREALPLLGHTPPAANATTPPTPAEQAVLACSADEFDLLAYLVASHHGKVRVALHAGPKDQDYRGTADGRGLPIRGVREGDVLPSIVLGDAGKPPLPALSLTLEPASLGLSAATGRSWRERTQGLIAYWGPGALAWLEGLLMAADRRASALNTVDPSLAPREEPLR